MPNNYVYHSIFDSGQASVLWPHSDWDTAYAKQSDYDEQLLQVIRFSLLWRPGLAFRHMDLFNNIPLMRFMCTNEAKTLCGNGMLHVLSQDDTPFVELFGKWGFQEDGQHLHHLPAEKQSTYNQLCKRQNRKQIEEFLLPTYEQFDVDLHKTLRSYDRHLCKRRVSLGWAPEQHLYSEKVSKILASVLDAAPSEVSGHTRNGIEQCLRNSEREPWRRRQWFTAVEAIQESAKPSAEDLAFLRQVKVGALNGAFFDELQEMKHSESDDWCPVSVSRELTSARAFRGTEDDSKQQDSSDVFSAKLNAFDRIPLRFILQWHDKGNTDKTFEAFRDSVALLEIALDRQSHLNPPRKIYRLIGEHIDILNACIDKTARDRNLQLGRQVAFVQARGSQLGPALLNSLGSTLSLAGSAISAYEGWIGMQAAMRSWAIASLTTAAITIMVNRPKTTREWAWAEGVLRESVLREHAAAHQLPKTR